MYIYIHIYIFLFAKNCRLDFLATGYVFFFNKHFLEPSQPVDPSFDRNSFPVPLKYKGSHPWTLGHGGRGSGEDWKRLRFPSKWEL